MKILLILFFVFAMTAHRSCAELLYDNDFSLSFIAGWYRATENASDFHELWSSTSTLESTEGNTYAHYEISIPTVPSNIDARWHSGFNEEINGVSSLPYKWELGFDIYVEVSEPIRVEFKHPRLNPPPDYEQRIYWVVPPSLGWQRVVITSADEATVTLSNHSISRTNMTLSIGLSSHDINGNPLALSSIGSYVFRIDNISLYSINPPSIELGVSPTGSVSVSYDGIVQSSSDLEIWTTMDPQPSSPFILQPDSMKHFYRTISE